MTIRPGGRRAFKDIQSSGSFGQLQLLSVLLRQPQFKGLLLAKKSKNNIANFMHNCAHSNLSWLSDALLLIVSM